MTDAKTTSNPSPAVLPMRRVARVTIEFTTAFAIGSGRGALTTDAMPVLDANGLPIIPGTSLAGILRHGFMAHLEGLGLGAAERRARVDHLFGAGAEVDDPRGSRLWVGFGHIHDQSDTPVDGRLDVVPDDPVLDSARELVVRDHVRIDHRGAAALHGKFDSTVVPAGHRFSFELLLETGPDEPYDDADFGALLSILAGPFSRLGGSTRRGLGAFEVVACRQRTFDLTDTDDARAFGALPVSLSIPAEVLTDERMPKRQDSATGWRTLELTLAAEDYWGFNGEERWQTPGEDPDTVPHFNPVREEYVGWRGHRGVVEGPRMYAPGSAIKGPIAHRVAFHYNLATQRFGHEAPVGEDNPAVQQCFGMMKRSTQDGSTESRVGRIFVDDAPIANSIPTQRIMHNSQDRFIGGVRRGILFGERCLYGGTLKIELRAKDLDEVQPQALGALRESLRDLAEGRLALGAGGGRGHGYFRLEDPAGVDFDTLWTRFAPEEASAC